MLLRYYSQFDGQPRIANIASRRFRIGSAPSNELTVSSPFVDPESLEIQRSESNWIVRVLGSNGSELNGVQFQRGA